MFASAVPLFKFVQNVEHVCTHHTCHNQKVRECQDNAKSKILTNRLQIRDEM